MRMALRSFPTLGDLRTTMAIAAAACLRAFKKMAEHSPMLGSTDSIINQGTYLALYLLLFKDLVCILRGSLLC